MAVEESWGKEKKKERKEKEKEEKKKFSAYSMQSWSRNEVQQDFV